MFQSPKKMTVDIVEVFILTVTQHYYQVLNMMSAVKFTLKNENSFINLTTSGHHIDCQDPSVSISGRRASRLSLYP